MFDRSLLNLPKQRVLNSLYGFPGFYHLTLLNLRWYVLIYSLHSLGPPIFVPLELTPSHSIYGLQHLPLPAQIQLLVLPLPQLVLLRHFLDCLRGYHGQLSLTSA
jgi:hypothetical protein